MTTEKYFEKNGTIYGISEKFSFGRWSGYVTQFHDLDEAIKWLHTEEHDFRERRLCSKSEAKKTGYPYINGMSYLVGDEW